MTSLLATLSRDLEALVARTAPSVVGVKHRRGQGSGLAFTPDGYILTNAHVLDGAKTVRVALADGRERVARIVGSDPPTDLAVLQVDASLPALPLAGGRDVRVGQLVVAIGNPLRFDRSVSLGVVSAVDRSLGAPRGGLLEGLIQTDAAINPGNSGGPLVDAEGTVLGINTAIVPWAQGIGFAVPSATATWVAAVLLQKGVIKRPFLGVHARGEELGPDLAARAGRHRAVRVLRVGDDTPARRGGLAPRDVIVAANGAPLGSVDDLQRVMVLADAPDIDLSVLRGETRHALTVRPRAA